MSVPTVPEDQTPHFELPAPSGLERILNDVLPPDFARMFAELHADLRDIRTVLCAERLPNIDGVIVVGGTPPVADTILRTAGRRYNMLFIPTATQQLTIQMASGPVSLTLNQGWQVVNFPENTRINSTAAAQALLIFRVTDDPQGGLF